MQWSRAQVDKEDNGETLPFMKPKELTDQNEKY